MRSLFVGLTVIVVLTAVIALVVVNHRRGPEADADRGVLTTVQSPERPPQKSALAPKGDGQTSKQKALAFLILMLKEGHVAR